MTMPRLGFRRCFTLSPVMTARFRRFKAHRRGYVSLWIFCILFFISLFAELIANDKPLLIWYGGHAYFPAFVSYPETTFGGDFTTEANYRDPYLAGIVKENKGKGGGWMLFPPIPYSYSTTMADLPTPAPSAPTQQNWLGTDDQGRDVLARLIYGFRISVLFGLLLTLFSALIGVSLGALQGYKGGWLDITLQRFIEIWSGVPTLYLLIILGALVTPSFWWLFGIMLSFSWMGLVDGVRAECLKTRNMDYVKAARALGVKERTILFRHVLPNSLVVTMTFLPFVLSGAITALTSLDFLGFGLPPGSPSLGEMLAQGKDNLQAPWLGISGFVVISIQLILLVFVGEALRNAFDPRGN